MRKTKYAEWCRDCNSFSCISWFSSLLLLGLVPAFGSPSSALREYNNGKYDQALEDYEQLLQRKDDPRLHFNAGASAYRNGRLDEAAKQFDEALNSPDLKLQQQAYFNRGNTLYYLGAGLPDPSKRTELWKKSVEDFRSTLKLDPQDTDAKFNYQYVKKKLEELKQQQQQQNQNKSDQQQNQDQQQQQQSQQNSQSKQDQNQQQKQEQQAQQNQSDQKQGSSQRNQQAQQKQDEQKQNAEQSQQQQAQKSQAEQQQNQQQQAAAQSGKPEDKSGEKEQNEAAMAYAEGQMTPDQARQLLDAQKGEEMMLPVKPEGKPVDQNKPIKDW